MILPDIQETVVSIHIGDIHLHYYDHVLTLEDVVDGRKEEKQIETEADAMKIVEHFCRPEAPGPAFTATFPFWV